MNISDFLEKDFAKIILSNKLDKSFAYNKAETKPILIKKKTAWQITLYTDKQAFQENYFTQKDLAQRLEFLWQEKYKQMNLFLSDEEIELKKSRKGKVMIHRQKKNNNPICIGEQNRCKKYLIQEGEKIPALIDIGVMTKEGKIIQAQRNKFLQINKFLEIIDDTLKNWKKSQITIIDFGCGKSYLTFVLYHYLTYIKKIKATIIGLDLKSEVIEKCNIVAQKYGYQNLSFKIGDIKGFKPTDKIDMVISLHACNTATDYALFNAIQWKVPMILSVPCCQHEINEQIQNHFPVLTKYGLLKERFSALLTDAIRANLLENQGYRVQILEFIDMEHTPKNILIRAIKTNKNMDIKEVDAICQNLHICPTLYNLIKKAPN